MDLSQRALQTNGIFFYKFQIRYQIIVWTLKNIQTNSEALILIKVQCVVYQWIRLDKLYKLMEDFFLISKSFFGLTTFSKNNCGVGFMHAWRWRHLCWSAGVLVLLVFSENYDLLYIIYSFVVLEFSLYPIIRDVPWCIK